MSDNANAAAVFAAARRANLLAVAQAHGFCLKKGSQEKWFCNRCPECGEGRKGGNAFSAMCDAFGIWRWACFCCGKKGTCIDFIAALNRCSDKEAAYYLARESGFRPVAAVTHIPPASTSPANTALTECIQLLSKHGLPNEENATRYLKGRGISEAVQQAAYERGLIRMLPSDPRVCHDWLCSHLGESRMKAAGLWREGSRWPAIAFRPLVSLLPNATSAEFRIIREAKPDEPKAIRYGGLKWPWWWKGGPAAKRVMIVEGTIDLMSLVQMGVDRYTHLMAIPGTGTWNGDWIKLMAERNPCEEVAIAIDRDVAGDSVVESIKASIVAANLRVYRATPATKDWNQDLVEGRCPV